jgi:hypothetical protein
VAIPDPEARIAELERQLADLRERYGTLAAKSREYSAAAVCSADTCVKAIERIQELDRVVKEAQDWRRSIYPPEKFKSWQSNGVRIGDAALVREVDAYTELERKRS